MPVRVITSPDPIVTPESIPGVTAGDAAVRALVASVTEQIDGPSGWLGRALGPQTLELSTSCWGDRSFRLPCPPIIAVLSVKYVDAHGVEQTVDPSQYALVEDLLWFRPSWSAPSLADQPTPVRVRYRAGYNGTSGAGAGELQTGLVPERARQAIILAVQDLRRLSSDKAGLRSETSEDIRSVTYLDSDKMSAVVERACDRLLSTLRVFR